ncbi:hypothetical protein ACEWY4_023216 [Coilia grayii]|uniref:ferroxidase n=1 Tax=Coilia grayii TaxID=363190 RepID=A0ABD1J5V4_9TELE
MRSCPLEGTLYAWLFLAFLSSAVLAVERHYFIAAVNIDWDYSYPGQHRSGLIHKKAVYREYEDAAFKKPKPHPAWLGLLGPTLRGQEGDVIIVTFRNMVDQPCNIHTHGVAYGKQSEGAFYFDNTSQKEKEDDVVNPGGSHTYSWEVTSAVAPTDADLPCLTYTYFSHVDIVTDYNSGLIGTLLVCKPDSLDESGKQRHFHQESILLFGIFDESLSWYSKGAPPSPELMKYTINGYTNGSIPGLSVCAYSSVSWHFLGMSSAPELFSVHFHGQVFSQNGHRVSSLGMVSGTTTSATMTAVHVGRWLITSYLSKHMEAGMHGFLTVEKCENFNKPVRKLSKQEMQSSRLWTYYIAAEEVTWDYTPNPPDYIDADFKNKYLKQGPDRIGRKYKKAVFTQYTDETFTKLNENKQRKMEQGIIGPVIRAQIRDQIRIVFKNKASRPYSIYPHGLTIDKAGEGANYPAGGNQSHAVQPGETHTYEWNVIEEDEPLASDPRCVTRMYHSAVNTTRDIASGLIGPLLICKSQSLNKRNVQMKADKEQHAMFAIFDENKSWYLDENIRDHCTDPARVRKDAPDFYASNVMHTINGYMFESGQVLGFCNREIATWHVSSVGEQNRIQTVTFYGHTFKVNDREEDILSLFPMTGETIFMDMDSKGDWLLSTLNSHDTTKGMRVKFKDVVCFRDMHYEDDYDDGNLYNMWKPPEPVSIKEDVVTESPNITNVIDPETDYWDDLFTVRSHKKSGNKTTSDMELLDLSGFAYLDNLPGENQTGQNPRNDLDAQTQEVLLTSPVSHVNNTLVDAVNSTQMTILNDTSFAVTVTGSPEDEKIIDMETDYWANVFNITSHKESGNKTTSDMELLDIKEYDYINNLPGENQTGQNPRNNSENIIEIENITDPEIDYWDDLFNISSHKKSGNKTTSDMELLDISEYDYLDNLPGENQTGQNPRNNSENIIEIEYITDPEIDYWDDLFNISSHKKSSNKTTSDMELLDISEYDYLDNLPGENQTGQNPRNDSDAQTQKVLLTSPVPPSSSILDDPAPSANSSVNNETESVHTYSNNTLDLLDDQNMTSGVEKNGSFAFESPNILLSDSSEDLNNTQTSSDITGEVSVDRNATVDTFTYSEIPLPSFPDRSNDSDTVFVPLDGDGLTEIGLKEVEEEEREDKQDSSSLYIIMDGSSENDTMLIKTLENIAEGTLYKQGNKTFSEVGISATSSPSDQVIRPLPVNLSSVENDTQVSLSNSSSESSELGSYNTSVSSSKRHGNESQESNEWSSSEEVVIYLTHNKSEGMKTHSLGNPREHWGYEVKHENVPLEIPEDLTKYIPNETKAKKEPKKKVIYRRVQPFKGHAMKTRKRKQYKPQPRSSLQARGFQPRGARPLSKDEEESLNNAIVIGVPQFNDYDLFTPLDDDEENLSKEEYEYIEYNDPYSHSVDTQGMTMDETTKFLLKNLPEGTNVRQYYLSAEEVDWDYGGYGQRRSDMKSDGRPTKFTKVVYRGYLDPKFKIPDIRGEVDEHLGILGPVIRAEVGDTIMVVFRNLASRPYSVHANGVSYSKQMEGLSYVDGTPYWYQEDNAVRFNQSYTYMWKVSEKVGPKEGEADCRTWAYYSGVNPEKDISSGLIGPLLICRKGSLSEKPLDVREFVLLFMTFDENKSWYYEKNYEMIQRMNWRTVQDPLFKENLKFPAINGIVYALKGLRMYTNQLANWHLINMGAANDVQSIHFHGQTFLNHQSKLHRQSVYPLLPGGLATLQMWPAKPGLWLLESEVGESQQRGMQTLFLVIDNDCGHPLGLTSGSIQDKQITASHARGYWQPNLARLHNSGKYNAWSTDTSDSWIQVDFQRPVVISKVATQGAKEMFYSNYVVNYTISYSTDRRKWVFYKGDSDTLRKTFTGNTEAHKVQENIFFPPVVGRFIRLHPQGSYNYPTMRMEYYGCELDGCSVPLGMKSGDIRDQKITASSTASNWYVGTWEAWLARLDKQGTVNAWQAKHNDMNQWLQVELQDVKKITGIITQGAKSLGTKMYVTAYHLEYSKDGIMWTKYTDDPDIEVKEFEGNRDNNDHKRNYIYPPIFAKFIRIVPRNWEKAIIIRLELLGCNFE